MRRSGSILHMMMMGGGLWHGLLHTMSRRITPTFRWPKVFSKLWWVCECLQRRKNIVLTYPQTKAWGTRCGGGGIPWNPTDSYINAITNELFLSAAAHLANRVPSKKKEYVSWAIREWDWFAAQGFIGENNTINDGLLDNCGNNGATV